MRTEIFQYVCKCDLCQRAKSAQNARVELHAAEPSTHPMEKIFVDFVGPLTRTKRGSSAILVVVDAFSKFVVFYPVRRISSQLVVDCCKGIIFPLMAPDVLWLLITHVCSDPT